MSVSTLRATAGQRAAASFREHKAAASTLRHSACHPSRACSSRVAPAQQARPAVRVALSARRAVVAQAGHNVYEGHVVAHSEARYAVVIARFNDLVTKLLLDGAVGALERHGVAPANIDVVWVPGSFELPVVAKSMAETGKFDAVVCIGTVVRGATTHYEAVVSGATSGVLNASTSTGVPVIFGVLTCDTMEQALDRAGGKVGNKGAEAAVTAVEMGNLMRRLRADGKAAPVGAGQQA